MLIWRLHIGRVPCRGGVKGEVCRAPKLGSRCVITGVSLNLGGTRMPISGCWIFSDGYDTYMLWIILIIVLLVLLFGGFGWSRRSR